MYRSSNELVNEDRSMSRRKAIKGGLAAAAGAVAAAMAARAGTAAVTPLDVKRPGFTMSRVGTPTTQSVEDAGE